MNRLNQKEAVFENNQNWIDFFTLHNLRRASFATLEKANIQILKDEFKKVLLKSDDEIKIDDRDNILVPFWAYLQNKNKNKGLKILLLLFLLLLIYNVNIS